MKAIAIVIIGFLLVASPALIGAEDSLSAAKDLYAAAAYDEALSMLTRLTQASPAPPETAWQVDQYRAFCLFAMGRTREAETIAESMIRKAPLTLLESADASPRLEQMFTNVRQRLLPSLIRERYRAAKSGIDQKKFATAEPHLVDAQRMLAAADKLGIEDDGLSDLQVLVDGFLQLIRTTAEQSPAQETTSTGAQPTATGVAARATTSQPSNGAARVSAPPASAAAPEAAVAGTRVYSAADDGLTMPVAISQNMPPMTPDTARLVRAAARKNGILEVVIDENGDVVDAVVRQSLHPSVDQSIASAARRWKYRPAMKDGVPVRFVKAIALMAP